MRRRLLVVCALLFLGVHAAGAQARWTAAVGLPHPVGPVAGNARGEQALLWEIFTDTAGYDVAMSYVQARVRRADGRLTRPQTLTRPALNTTAVAIGLDDRGTATSLLTELVGDHQRILVGVRPRDGRFGSLVEVGRMGGEPDALRMAVAADGAAVVAWSDGLRVRAARRPAGVCASGRPRACFGAVQDVGPRCPPGLRHCIEIYSPSLALTVGSRGRSALAWTSVQRRDGVYSTVMRFASTSGARGFGAARTISQGFEPAVEPALAALADGRVVAAWTARPTYNSARIATAVLDSAGRRSEQRTITGMGCHEPRAVVDRNDDVTLAWRCRPGGYGERLLALAVRPAGGPFGAPLPISPGDAVEPALVVDSRGTTFVFFTAGEVRVRIRAAGGEVGPALRVAAGSYPRVVAAGERVTVFIARPRRARGPYTTTMRDWIG